MSLEGWPNKTNCHKHAQAKKPTSPPRLNKLQRPPNMSWYKSSQFWTGNKIIFFTLNTKWLLQYHNYKKMVGHPSYGRGLNREKLLWADRNTDNEISDNDLPHSLFIIKVDTTIFYTEQYFKKQGHECQQSCYYMIRIWICSWFLFNKLWNKC